MDGNRRYAQLQGLPSKASGHLHGSKKFEEVMEWMFELGVKAITVYALSIENFKRPAEEVETLMCLAMEKFEGLAKNR
jgi:undecaprenyl diphosphate synthase